jgi:tetratricopeptide (TPR) repeat protein
MDLRVLVGGGLLVAGLVVPTLLDLEPGAALAQEDANAAADEAASDAPTSPFAERAEAPVSVPLVVEHRVDGDGVEYATVVGSNVSLFTVARRLAEASNRLLFGFEERALAAPLVSLELRDRPLEEVLEYALGSAGLVAELSPSVLQVRPDRLVGDRDGLLMRALVFYSRSSMRQPSGPLAPSSRLAQGRIEEERGNDDAAIGHYQLLLESHPASPLVLEASLRIGLVLARQREWTLALDQFTQLTEISPEALDESSALVRPLEEYQATARLEIARCNLELGRSEFALLILNVLERESPQVERSVVVDRGLVRAQAYLAGEAWLEALRVLDGLDRGHMPSAAAIEALGIRARAFEGLDLRKEAARAWLTLARQVEDPERAQAYRRAAELFLALQDHLGVLFLAGEVARSGSSADIGTEERLARAALGLEVALDAENSSVQERYEAAVRAAEREDWSQVGTLVRPLVRELELVPLDLRDEIVLAHAQYEYVTTGLEAALAALREARVVMQRIAPDAVGRLDGYAGQLLEDNRLYELALEAYDGRY